MKVTCSKQFTRYAIAAPKEIRHGLKIIYAEFEKAKKVGDVKGVARLVGYTKYYRMNIQHYRLGFECTDETVHFLSLLHRKENQLFY